MGLHADLLKDLQNERNPEKALQRLRNAYPTESKWPAAMSMWKGVRYSILHDESNRDPRFHLELMQLLNKCGRSDQLKILELDKMPLYEQYKILSIYRTEYLDEQEMDDKLSELEPLYPYFYEFSFPDDMEEYCRSFYEDRDTAVNQHEWKSKDQYNITKEEAESIVQIANDVLLNPDAVNSPGSYLTTVSALLVVTGRRMNEIVVSMTMFPSSHPYQAQVTGLCKNGPGSQSVITIPLLAPYKNVEQKFREIREYRNFTDLSVKEVSSRLGSSLLSSTKRLFGRSLVHTQKRNLYAEMCYTKRNSQNGFLTGNQSCSKHTWISSALGHAPSRTTNTMCYQVMTFDT